MEYLLQIEASYDPQTVMSVGSYSQIWKHRAYPVLDLIRLANQSATCSTRNGKLLRTLNELKSPRELDK